MLPSRHRPSHFIDSFEEPIFRLQEMVWPDRAGSDAPAILIFPMVDWHGRVQRSQQMVKALAAAGHQCIYVNPQLGLEYSLPYLIDPDARIKVLGEKILELHVHLAREHASDSRLLTRQEVNQVVSAIRRIIHLTGIRSAVQLVAFPRWTNVALALREEFKFPIVYDCHDFLPGFRRIASEILNKEEALLRDCDLAVFSSQNLMAKMKLSTAMADAKAVVIRNGVDAEVFESALRARTAGRRRVAGYVGAIDHWFDFESVVVAALEHPDWTFELIGRPEDSQVQRLERSPNVSIVGELPHKELPGRMALWDVAMIPFLRNELTQATNPIKLYEYLSAGLPVVSTRLPEAELYRDLIYCADTPQQFAAQLGLAVAKDTDALRLRRVSFARRETWSKRAQALLASCESRGLLKPLPSSSGRELLRDSSP